MKYILIAFIQIYWLLVPERKRRSCIFSISCSKHVKETLIKKGTISGIKSLLFRLQNCKSGYVVKEEEGQIYLFTKKNVKVDSQKICPAIINHFKAVQKTHHSPSGATTN